MTELIGTADHYAAFVKLCRARIEQLGITYDTVDALAGFPARYCSTLMSGGKAMSVYSLFTMARVLALLPAFQHDQAQHELLSAREDWIKLRRKGARWRREHSRREHKLGPDYKRNWALRMALSRMKKLSPRQRRLIAQRAAQIRWGKVQNAERSGNGSSSVAAGKESASRAVAD